MKDMLQIMLLCMVLAMMAVFTNPRAAYADNNEAIKYCLEVYGYTPEKFDGFNWNGASSCFHEYAVANEKAKRTKIREFLEEKPWYKGKNWQWELRSEYACIKRYDMNGIEICSKPYYLN
jgi:hypothetical protein